MLEAPFFVQRVTIIHGLMDVHESIPVIIREKSLLWQTKSGRRGNNVDRGATAPGQPIIKCFYLIGLFPARYGELEPLLILFLYLHMFLLPVRYDLPSLFQAPTIRYYLLYRYFPFYRAFHR